MIWLRFSSPMDRRLRFKDAAPAPLGLNGNGQNPAIIRPMESTATKHDSHTRTRLLPVLVDGAAVVVLLLWGGSLSQQLMTPSGWNALVLVFLYVLFCIGVYLSRKLLPLEDAGRWQPPHWLMDPRLRGALGVVFALFMTTTFAYQLGYFEAIYQIRAGLMEEGSTAAFFVFAPGAWFGFSMFVILVLAFPVNSNIAGEDGRYSWFCLISLVLTDALLVFSTAQTRAMMHGLGFSSSAGLLLMVLAALLLSFIVPRAIYQSRQPFLSGWITFVLLLLTAGYGAVFG